MTDASECWIPGRGRGLGNAATVRGRSPSSPVLPHRFSALAAAALLVPSAFLMLGSAFAAPGPLRVLHIGREGSPSADHAHVQMRELGRDAIWFEVTIDAADG